ncbi:unnamed protein product, partial [Porites evermanni]
MSLQDASFIDKQSECLACFEPTDAARFLKKLEVHSAFHGQERSGQFSPTELNDLRNLTRDIRVIEQLFQELPVFSPSSCYRTPVRHTGSVGRPAYEISREQLMLLRSCFFLWSTIASILGVSRWTIHRRVNELQIPLSFVTYSH